VLRKCTAQQYPWATADCCFGGCVIVCGRRSSPSSLDAQNNTRVSSSAACASWRPRTPMRHAHAHAAAAKSRGHPHGCRIRVHMLLLPRVVDTRMGAAYVRTCCCCKSWTPTGAACTCTCCHTGHGHAEQLLRKVPVPHVHRRDPFAPVGAALAQVLFVCAVGVCARVWCVCASVPVRAEARTCARKHARARAHLQSLKCGGFAHAAAVAFNIYLEFKRMKSLLKATTRIAKG